MKIYRLNEYGHGTYEENEKDEKEKDGKDENFYILTDIQIAELTEKIDRKISTMIQGKNTKNIKNSIKDTIKLYLSKYCTEV
ncbi:hypothetical protein M0Q97_02940 [Candidatus Dojkabacteria bacterium]|jgi:hypothetical protein|nr:hypothetical protein [Candidatus Dojkabacteria bacterium]